MIAGPTVILLVVYAFVQRRRVRAHAAAMLATALLVLPPILGRLVQRVPLIPADGGFGLSATELAFVFAWAVTTAIALGLARGPARTAFAIAVAATLAQAAGFFTVGATPTWETFVVGLIALPVLPVALAGGVGAFGLLWWAWRRVPPRGTAAAAGGRAAVAA